jgi:hypothetical protein
MPRHDCEFVAARTGYEIGLARGGSQSLRHDGQYFIPLRVTVYVVNTLEAVEIEHQDRVSFFGSGHPVQTLTDGMFELASIGEPS